MSTEALLREQIKELEKLIELKDKHIEVLQQTYQKKTDAVFPPIQPIYDCAHGYHDYITTSIGTAFCKRCQVSAINASFSPTTTTYTR